MHVAMVFLAAFAGAMEVTQEPVALVLKYPEMQQISLSPEDVMIYSEQIPRIETIENSQVVYAERSMAEMVAANVPEPPPESKPTLPNESRKKKRLDHTPPFTGTVTGDVSIIKSGTNERIVVVSNLQGDGVMQVMVKEGTARSKSGEAAKPVLNAPKVIVRNTTQKTANFDLGGAASPKAVSALSEAQKTSLESHFKGALPANLKVVSEAVVVD